MSDIADRARSEAAMRSAFLALGLMLSWVPAALAVPCVDYGNYVHWAGNFDLPQDREALAVASRGEYVFVGFDGFSFGGLYALNVSDPAAPVIVGQVLFPDQANSVTVSGNYAYVAHDTGLKIVDISNPASPAIVGGTSLPDLALDVQVAGNYAYIACNDAGLRIMNVANPALPVIVGSINTPGRARDVAVAGSYAYVADGIGGLQVIQVSNPSAPVIVATVPIDQSIAVTVRGSYAYLVGTPGPKDSFFTIDVSIPTAPVVVGSVPMGFFTTDVTTRGSLAFVSSSDVLSVFDLSNPVSPVVIGLVGIQGVPLEVAAEGNRAYVVGGYTGLDIIDISNARTGPILSSLPVSGSLYSVAAWGDIACVADNSGASLQVIDVSNQSAPAILASVPLNWAQDVVFDGRHAFVAVGADGLRIIDLAIPTSPFDVGSVDTPLNAMALAVQGQLVYIADQASLEIVDISTISSPQIIGSIPVLDFTQGVAVRGDYAYVADYDVGLEVVDVSNPHAPVIVGHLDTPGEALQMAVEGDYVYLADDLGGFKVVDVSIPTSPALAASLNTRGAFALSLAGGLAYVASRYYGLDMIDVSNPAAPAMVGNIYIPITVADVDTDGYYVYAVGGERFNILSGQCALLPVAVDDRVPTPAAGRSALGISRPNPLRVGQELATIDFLLAREGVVTLRVIDANGRLVRTLVDGEWAAGRHVTTWNGQNAAGHTVASGVYFYRLDAPESSTTRRLVCVR